MMVTVGLGTLVGRAPVMMVKSGLVQVPALEVATIRYMYMLLAFMPRSSVR